MNDTDQPNATGQQSSFVVAATQPQLTPKTFLTAAQIKAAEDSGFDDVPVPEWNPNGFVHVVKASGDDRDEFEDSIVSLKKELGKHGRVKVTRDTVMKGARAKAAFIGCRDPQTGARIFSEADLEWLGGKSAAPLDRIFQSWMHMAGMTEADVEALGNGSTPGQSGGSTSASH